MAQLARESFAGRLFDATFGLIPQCYYSEYGPFETRLKFQDISRRAFTLLPLPPSQAAFLASAERLFPQFLNLHRKFQVPGIFEVIQEALALEWLKSRFPNVDWTKLLDYARVIGQRTNENRPISLNLVVSEGKGAADITTHSYQKLIDHLGASPYSYFRVARDLTFLGYEEIEQDNISGGEFKLHPEFLHPFKCVLKGHECSAHLTSRGDLLVMTSLGLLASKRNGRWKIYEMTALRQTLGAILRDRPLQLSGHVFELMFDLSYRRHGALLVFDDRQHELSYVLNAASVVFPVGPTTDDVRKMIGMGLSRVMLNLSAGGNRRKRLLLEAASLDGAVVLNRERILAVGAMIKSHAAADRHVGARSTAAESAFRWGATPIKISADGEISVQFASSDKQGRVSDAVISFS